MHTGKRRKPESNPRSNPEYNVPSENKRQKLHVEDSEEEVDVQESKVLTVMGVSKQVRSSLRKWMAKQKNDQLGQLHEGEHYSLQIMPKGTPGVFFGINKVPCMWDICLVASGKVIGYGF